MIRLDDIRDSLEGHVPGLVATCSADGMPNVCYLSQVEYVNPAHVGLTFQFFNKTRQNILCNPYACVTVVDPFSAAVHELSLRYLRTDYTLASRGYEASGIGSEIPLGAGAVGIAAQSATPIRLAHAAAEYGYVRAIRERAAADPTLSVMLENTIPFPGLREPASQLAVPIASGRQVFGVLHVESEQSLRFDHADEDALVVLARQLALALRELDSREEAAGSGTAAGGPAAGGARQTPASGPARAVTGAALVVRRYARDDSIFLNDDYLIKGVAGAIFWSLMRAWCGQGRESFTNRELRMDPGLGLPEPAANLETRLHLLDRRLRERDCGILIERTGRGRFRLLVRQPVRLSDCA